MERKTRVFVTALLFMLVAAISLAACGGDDDAESKEAAVCEGLLEVQVAVEAYSALDPATASLDDYNAAADEIESQVSDVIDDARGLDEQRAEDFESAVNDFDSAIDDNSDLAIPELVQTVQPQLDAALAAWTDLRSGIDCP